MRISDWSSDVCSSDLGERWIAVGIVRIELCLRCFCGDSWLIFAGFLSAPKISGNGNSHQRQRAESPYRLPVRLPHFGRIRRIRNGGRPRGSQVSIDGMKKGRNAERNNNKKDNAQKRKR